MDWNRKGQFGLVLLGLLGATVFGMVLAGALNLTVASLGAADDDSPDGVGGRVATHAAESIASFADLAEAVLPAVASIRSITIEEVGADDAPQSFFERFFDQGGPQEHRQDGGGSGFVVSPDGWIVTNFHVVDGATRVTVRLDGSEYEAEVEGVDAATDLAVVKIDAEGLTYLELGDSDALRVGDWVMAIGSPHGLESSVTVGVVSAKGRDGTGLVDRSFEDFIQTDAAINSGNSGGPLVNTAGQVVGIATAMNFGAENIAFAVPVKTLADILPQLRSEGRVTRGYLGVNIRDLEEREWRTFPGLSSRDGALILRVLPETPAAKADLRAGDVVLRVDGVPVARTDDLISYVSKHRPGTTVLVDIVRQGEQMQQKVLLEDREGLTVVAELEEDDSEKLELEWLGLQYQDLDSTIRGMAGVPDDVEGVFVADLQPSSPLYDEGIRRGDVLAEVNGSSLRSAEDLEAIVASARSGDYLRFYYLRPTRQGMFADFAVVEVP